MQLLGLVQTPVTHIQYSYILNLYNIMNWLWNVYLSQKSSGYEPKTVVDAELVLHHVVLNNTEEQIPIFHFDKIQFLLKQHIPIVDVNNTEGRNDFDGMKLGSTLPTKDAGCSTRKVKI